MYYNTCKEEIAKPAREKRGKKMDALEMLNKGMDRLNALLDEIEQEQEADNKDLARIGKILDELA